VGLRLWLVSTQYRQPVNYTQRALEEASERAFYVYQAVRRPCGCEAIATAITILLVCCSGRRHHRELTDQRPVVGNASRYKLLRCRMTRSSCAVSGR